MPDDLALAPKLAAHRRDNRSLYERDFVLWSEEQAAALRAAAASGANLPLDWENLAEEIESLGKSLRAELRSRMGIVVEHLAKLKLSSAVEPRRGWVETVKRERVDIADLLEEHPSLRATLTASVAAGHRKGRQLASISLERHGELTPEVRRELARISFAERQVLGPWLPDDLVEGGG